MVFTIVPSKLEYTVGEQVTIQVNADPNVTWDLNIYKDNSSVELFAKTGTGSLVFNISLIIAQNGAGQYQIAGATRYVSGYDAVIIRAVGTGGGAPQTLKAVQFTQAWANVMSDFELKAIAKVAILEMGDELTSEPVYREGGYAYVVFVPSPVKFVEAGISLGLTKLVKSFVSWATKNPGKAVGIVAVFGLTYWGIAIVDWQTKVEEAKIVISDTIKTGINEILASTIPDVDKVKLITLLLEKQLGIDDKGTEWGTIIMILGGLAIGVYLLKDVIGGKK